MASENNQNNVVDYLNQQLKDVANIKVVSKENIPPVPDDIMGNIKSFTGVGGKKHKTKKKREKDKKKKSKRSYSKHHKIHKTKSKQKIKNIKAKGKTYKRKNN